MRTGAERVESVVRHQALIHQFSQRSPHTRRLDRSQPRQIGRETGTVPVKSSISCCSSADSSTGFRVGLELSLEVAEEERDARIVAR